MVQRAVLIVAVVCVPCGPHHSLIYAWAWGFCVCWKLSAAEQIKPDCCRTPAVVSILLTAACVLTFYRSTPLHIDWEDCVWPFVMTPGTQHGQPHTVFRGQYWVNLLFVRKHIRVQRTPNSAWKCQHLFTTSLLKSADKWFQSAWESLWKQENGARRLGGWLKELKEAGVSDNT